MRKLLLFLLLSTLCWTNQTLFGLTKIKCSIVPLDRGSRHTGIDTLSSQVKTGSSINWSGYVSATNLLDPKPKSVSFVSGSWTIPKLIKTADKTFSSMWVGIDGYRSKTVEQIGTESDWINGKQQNYAWFEMYPEPSYLIKGFPVEVGDRIYAEVKYIKNNTFQMTIRNKTKGVYSVVPTKYTKTKQAARSCAEWILEAPSNKSGLLPLAHFNEAEFSKCRTTINDVTGDIGNQSWEYCSIKMQNQNNLIKVLTSSLTKNKSNFTLQWRHQ